MATVLASSPFLLPALFVVGGFLILAGGWAFRTHPSNRARIHPLLHPAYEAIVIGAFMVALGLIQLAWRIGKHLGAMRQ